MIWYSVFLRPCGIGKEPVPDRAVSMMKGKTLRNKTPGRVPRYSSTGGGGVPTCATSVVRDLNQPHPRKARGDPANKNKNKCTEYSTSKSDFNGYQQLRNSSDMQQSILSHEFLGYDPPTTVEFIRLQDTMVLTTTVTLQLN